jgi:colanic acid/amylovoran biosynthesis protein
MTTGDDAIELAYAQRPAAPGDGLGVNLRMSAYAAVDEQLVARLRPILQAAAQAVAAPLIPVPISTVPGEADTATIDQLLLGYPLKPVEAHEELETPLALIRRIQRCRVVVSGSYHAAVFALSMGIPAVGLARSAYYEDKFLGLADQFGPGCQVVLLDDPNLDARLPSAITAAWRSAAGTRPQLLAAAAQQVALSHIAYQRIVELIEARTKQKQKPRPQRALPALVEP